MKTDKTKPRKWQLRTLGAARLDNGAKRVKLSRRKSFAIFVYLVVSKRPCARETLANRFWPDLPEREARTALRTSLSDLNRALGKGWLTQSGDNLCISKDLSIEVDVFTLAQAAKNNSIASLDKLEQWQYDFLEGFYLEGCEVFEEWCYAQRQGAKNSLFQVMNLQLSQLLSDRNWSAVSELAALWLKMDPLCETPYLALMRMHQNLGQASQARLQYHGLKERLEIELGVSPSSETQRLFRTIEEGLSQHEPKAQIQDETVDLRRTDVTYARNGEVHIAYKQFGTAKPALVVITGFISHLEQLFEEPQLRRFFAQLAERFNVLVFDKRGMGLSDRIGYPPSVHETAGDVIAVLDHAGIDKSWLMGISEGGPAAIQCAHDNPSRVEALLLFGTTAKWTASDNYPHSLKPEQYDSWLDILEDTWGTAVNLEYFAPSCSNDEFMVKWWKKTLRLASSPGAIRAVLDNAKDIDVRPCLKNTLQPTLVVQQHKDRLVRAENGRYLAAHLPNCDYLEVPGDDHWLWVTDTTDFFRKLDEFSNKHGFS